MTHEENLRHFTFGHGGYFSPQTFLHVGIPVKLRWSREKVSAELTAEPGLDAFHEDGAPYHPTDPARQALLTTRARTGRARANGFPERDHFGASFSGRGAVEWAAAQGLVLGAGVDVRAAEAYRELVALFTVEQRLLE